MSHLEGFERKYLEVLEISWTELQRKKEEEKRLKKLYDKVTPQLIKHIKLWANKTIMQPAYVKFLSKCHGK